jgi:hypothetical protein
MDQLMNIDSKFKKAKHPQPNKEKSNKQQPILQKTQKEQRHRFLSIKYSSPLELK